MSKREDEEVDAFGRTVVSKGRRFNDSNDINHNRDLKFQDNRNNFPVADRRPDDRRNDFPNKDFGNRDFHNNSKQLRPNLDYRDDRKQDWGSRDRSPPRNGRPYGNFDDQQGGSNQNRRFNNKDRSLSPPRYNDGPRHAPVQNQQQQSLASLPATNRILPIMSFKSFMQTQHDDLAPEVFQRKYEEYHLHYLGDFSKAFFRASVGEEWFQDRYNPVLIQELEKEAVTWAAKESAELKSLLLESPLEAVQGMSLDPPVKRAYVKPPHSAVAAVSVKESVEDGDVASSTGMVVAPDDHQNVSIVSTGGGRGSCGRHFSGHENRTIYLSGIHACCTKAVLRGAINDAIASSARIPSPQTHGEADVHVATDGVVIPAPERIVIAQPVWSKLFLEKFERSAWVIMPTAVAARQAVAVLKELVVDVPGPVDPLSGDKRTLFSFTLSAAFHIPKQTHVVPENMSHPLRVKADTQRALTLAALLDEDRAVPTESSLATILEEPAVQAALVKPTDQLDVAIAYLRRVHFLALYGGKRYRDESHLLANAASVVYRSKPCALPAPPLAPRPEGEDSSMTVGSSEDDSETVQPTSVVSDAAAVAEGSVGSKRKFDGEGEEEGESDMVSEDAESKPVVVEAGEEKDDEAAAASTAVAQKAQSVTSFSSSAKGHNVPVSDRRIESLISDLRTKRKIATSNAESDVKVPLTADEADAEVLLAKQEKAYMLCVETTCKVEKEGKARCCYSFCKKLFKDLDFLSKHLRSKHDDFALDALQAQAEPYMLQRFEAEDISARPLPPVEVESHGTIELKSVKEILDKYLVAQQQQAGGGGARDNFRGNNFNRGDNHHNQGRFDNRGGDRQNDRRHDNHGNNDHHQNSTHRRGNDDRDRRATIGGSRPAAAERQYVEPRPEDKFARRISSYLDVDAPKESAVSIDYGVALLPPVKRRKLLVKKDAAIAPAGTVTATTEMTTDNA